MIILPTKRRLTRKRDALYAHLQSVIQHASIHQVEDIMRDIHRINQRLLTYFRREDRPEPTEIFDDNA